MEDGDPAANKHIGPRVLIAQWAGDYRETYLRLANGGPENYYAQRYSIHGAGQLAREFVAYGVISALTPETYDEVLANGVRALGAGFAERKLDMSAVLAMMERFQPTHLIVNTPNPHMLRWGLDRGLEVLPLFADSFILNTAGLSLAHALVRRWRFSRYRRRLSKLLRDPRLRWLGNHNVNASRELVRLGVSAARVVPWDWPPALTPEDYSAKLLPDDDRPWQLLFVGMVYATKGVGDVIATVGELKKRGRNVRLRIIGAGDQETFARQAQTAGLGKEIIFEGRQAHPLVIAAMRDADVALVPSWHEYPEGLPMTIYESLSARTPLICSDHPMFLGRVGEGRSAIVVPQKRPERIADAVEELLGDRERYHRMSQATEDTWRRIVCPVQFYDLIRHWVSARPEEDAWLSSYSLASGRYD